MELLNNPFNVLGISTRDNRKRIIESAKEKNLFMDSDILNEASSILTHPKNRLTAEIAWMPGVLPSKYKVIFAALAQETGLSHELMGQLTEYSPLTQLNILSAELEKYDIYNISTISNKIIYLDYLVQKIEFTELKTLINEDRTSSGFPEIEDIELIINDLNDHLRNLCNSINSKIERIGKDLCVELISLIVRNTTNESFYTSGIIITSILDWYELYSENLLDEGKEKIFELIENIENEFDPNKITTQVESVIKKLAIWDKLASPLQVYKREQGLVHESSRQLGRALREFAMYLHNECEEIDISQKLIVSLGKVFEELDEFAERINEDIETLDENKRQKAMYLQIVAEEKRNRRIKNIVIAALTIIVFGYFTFFDVDRPNTSSTSNSGSPSYSQSQQSGSSSLSDIGNQIDSLIIELTNMENELNSMASTLSQYNSDVSYYESLYTRTESSFNYNNYSSAVDDYNYYLEKYNSLHNAYESKLDRCNTLVDKYNSRL